MEVKGTFSAPPAAREHIVLTPRVKKANSTTLWIERKAVESVRCEGNVHVAGGDHHGILVNKEAKDDETAIFPSQLSLEFRVYLVNAQTGVHTQELRTLRFWFRPVLVTETEQAAVAFEFFRELVYPKNFPRDYVGFITKIMKLMQYGYQKILRIELVMCQLENSVPLERPPSTDDSNSEKMVELTEEKVVEAVELYYPNPITIQDLSRYYDWDEEEIEKMLNRLQNKGIIKSMDSGGYTRVTQGDTDVKIVKQMPKMVKAEQPTIAIITAQFTEKLAVDAMIENKETFVRYTTIGESNVYTLGNIGEHRVVCTKLPSLGHTREAMTAAGNTTTRLLGTFQNVDHVILVGVAGGVPHFTDYSKHVRLGDVIISHASPVSDFIYISCEGAVETSPNSFDFSTNKHQPKNSILQNIGAQIKVQTDIDNADHVWKLLDEGLNTLETETEHNFMRPSADSDKLYMAIGEKDLIEVTHPLPSNNKSKRVEGRPRIHLGVIGAGREIARSDHLRQKFSHDYHVSAYVCEFDPVILSIVGNCRDSFILIRGISDYKDGTKKTEWQTYSALAAASVTKAIISALVPTHS